MRIGYGLAVLLAAGGGLGTAMATAAAPPDQRTHPHVSPRVGGTESTFQLSFTLRDTPGRQGTMETEYRVAVAPRGQAASACTPPQPPPVTSGQKGEVVRLTLNPPNGGWCLKRYRVTVFLERASSCSARPAGAELACPQAPSPPPLDTGRAHFRIRRA